MANVTLRSTLIFAVLAFTGSAFRHDISKVMESMKDDIQTEGNPPDINPMMDYAISVATTMQERAHAAFEAAQQALMNHMQMNMSSRNSNRRANNTRGRNASHSAVDDMYDAKNAEMEALEVKNKVSQMKEVCAELINAVLGFKNHKEQNAATEIAAVNEQQAGQHQDLLQRTIEAERLDLSNLLGLLDEIAAAKAQVTQLDANVRSGASAAIVDATGLVDSMAQQLQARFQSLAHVDAAAFAEMQLQPPDAKLMIDRHSQQSLDKVNKFLDRLVQNLNREYQGAQAAMNEAFTQNKRNQTSKNELHDMVNRMYAINEQLADAGELREAITHAIQVITNFFRELGGYRTRQATVVRAATLEARQIVAQADEVRRGIEESLLADGGIFFHMYQIMWVRHNQAKKAMPEERVQEYEDVSQSITTTAQAIHAWLNEEMMLYCDKYLPDEGAQAEANAKCNQGQCLRHCARARAILVHAVNGEREATVNWCDERFTKTRCIEENGGLAPNGKACGWTEGDATGKTGIRGRCDPNKAPTSKLPYGRKDKTGQGLFF